MRRGGGGAGPNPDPPQPQGEPGSCPCVSPPGSSPLTWGDGGDHQHDAGGEAEDGQQVEGVQGGPRPLREGALREGDVKPGWGAQGGTLQARGGGSQHPRGGSPLPAVSPGPGPPPRRCWPL